MKTCHRGCRGDQSTNNRVNVINGCPYDKQMSHANPTTTPTLALTQSGSFCWSGQDLWYCWSQYFAWETRALWCSWYCRRSGFVVTLKVDQQYVSLVKTTSNRYLQLYCGVRHGSMVGSIIIYWSTIHDLWRAFRNKLKTLMLRRWYGSEFRSGKNLIDIEKLVNAELAVYASLRGYSRIESHSMFV